MEEVVVGAVIKLNTRKRATTVETQAISSSIVDLGSKKQNVEVLKSSTETERTTLDKTHSNNSYNSFPPTSHQWLVAVQRSNRIPSK